MRPFMKPAPVQKSSPLRARLARLGGYVLAVIAILLCWVAFSYLLNTPALPMPTIAFEQFVARFADMLPHIAISLWRVVAAMLSGTVLGLALGLYIGRSQRADRIASPLIYLLYPIPKVVFLPVLMILLGLGDAPKIVLIGVVIFFQTLVTARGAAKAIAPECIASVRSLGASSWSVARHVVIPASLPDVFTALRINTGTAIAVLFFTESIAGSTGIGYYIVNAWGRIDYPAMFAGIIAMALMGVALYELINLIEFRLLRWVVRPE